MQSHYIVVKYYDYWFTYWRVDVDFPAKTALSYFIHKVSVIFRELSNTNVPERIIKSDLKKQKFYFLKDLKEFQDFIKPLPYNKVIHC